MERAAESTLGESRSQKYAGKKQTWDSAVTHMLVEKFLKLKFGPKSKTETWNWISNSLDEAQTQRPVVDLAHQKEGQALQPVLCFEPSQPASKDPRNCHPEGSNQGAKGELSARLSSQHSLLSSENTNVPLVSLCLWSDYTKGAEFTVPVP